MGIIACDDNVVCYAACPCPVLLVELKVAGRAPVFDILGVYGRGIDAVHTIRERHDSAFDDCPFYNLIFNNSIGDVATTVHVQFLVVASGGIWRGGVRRVIGGFAAETAGKCAKRNVVQRTRPDPCRLRVADPLRCDEMNDDCSRIFVVVEADRRIYPAIYKSDFRKIARRQPAAVLEHRIVVVRQHFAVFHLETIVDDTGLDLRSRSGNLRAEFDGRAACPTWRSRVHERNRVAALKRHRARLAVLVVDRCADVDGQVVAVDRAALIADGMGDSGIVA